LGASGSLAAIHRRWKGAKGCTDMQLPQQDEKSKIGLQKRKMNAVHFLFADSDKDDKTLLFQPRA